MPIFSRYILRKYYIAILKYFNSENIGEAYMNFNLKEENSFKNIFEIGDSIAIWGGGK